MSVLSHLCVMCVYRVGSIKMPQRKTLCRGVIGSSRLATPSLGARHALAPKRSGGSREPRVASAVKATAVLQQQQSTQQ